MEIQLLPSLISNVLAYQLIMIAVLLAIPVTKERETVTQMENVQEVSYVEKTTAETSVLMLKRLLTAVYQVPKYLGDTH